MRILISIVVLFVGFQMSAQNQMDWLTDNSVALKESEAQNKPILVFVTDNQKSKALEALRTNFFNSENFTKWSAKVILLKIDISNQRGSNVRLGIHYTKQKTAPGLSLIDKNGKRISEPLVNMTSENILNFQSSLHDKL